jgi:Cu+-exporting ATPase
MFVPGAHAGAESTKADAEPAAARAAEPTASKTVVIPVEGMSCMACVARVKKALGAVAGVTEVRVNLVERNARVKFDSSRVSPDRLADAINRLGYHAGTPIEVR